MRHAGRVAAAKRAVLFITALGLPLVFFGRHEDEPFNITKLSLLLAGVSCALALHLVQIGLGHRTRGLRETTIPALALTIPLTLSWFFTAYQEWALFGPFSRFTGLIPYVAFAVLGILLVDAFWGRPEPLANGIAVVGAIVGAYAVIQAVGLDPLWQPGVDSGFPPSTVGHSNFAGGFLGICLPFSILLWVRGESSWLGMSTTIATSLGLLITNSQGGWVAAAAGTIIVIAALAGRRWRIAPVLGVVITCALASVIVTGIALSARATEPVLGGTAKSRGLYWATALEMGADSPLVGKGPGAYAVEGVRYRHLDLVLLEPNQKADDPHSVPLAFWANAGIPGALGLLVLILWIVRSGLRLSAGNLIGAAAFGGCAAYLLQALVSIDEPSQRAGFWVAVAALAISSSSDKTSDVMKSPPRRSLYFLSFTVATAILLSASGTTYAFGLMKAHRQTLQAKTFFKDRDIEQAIATYRQAVDFRFEPRYLAEYAFYLGASALDAGSSGESLLDEMTSVYEYLNYFPETHALMTSAKTYLYWSHFEPTALDRAEDALLAVEPLDPENPRIEIQLAEVHMARGDALGAIEILEPISRSSARNLGGFWGTLSMARALSGDLEGGKADLELALAVDPTSCGVLTAHALFQQVDHGRISDQATSSIRFNCGRGVDVFLQDLIQTYNL